jgi:hypothetical protein
MLLAEAWTIHVCTYYANEISKIPLNHIGESPRRMAELMAEQLKTGCRDHQDWAFWNGPQEVIERPGNTRSQQCSSNALEKDMRARSALRRF